MVERFQPTAEAATPADRAAEIVLGGGAPVPLPSGEGAWQVAAGAAEAYLVWPGGRRLLAVLASGDMAFGVAAGSRAAVHLITQEGARLLPVPQAAGGLAAGAERWIAAAVQGLDAATPSDAEIGTGAQSVTKGARLVSRHGVRWVAPGPGLALDLGGAGEMVLAPDMAPVTGPLWARALGNGPVTVRTTAELEGARLIPLLAQFTETVAALAEARARRADIATLARLGAVPDGGDEAGAQVGAVRAIAGALGLGADDLAALSVATSTLPLPALCRVAGLRARKITVDGGWHRRDHGPLLARPVDGETYEPLLWDGRGYRSPAGPRLTAEAAEGYAHTAYAVSAPLPVRVKGLWSLALHVMRQGNRRDATTAAFAAAFAAGLGILVPLATAWLLSDIVPAGIGGLLIAVGVALVCATLVTTVLSTARGLATTRIEGRGATTLGAALTDRLLRLPARFFKDFAAGDLNQRLENVETMRQLAVAIMMSAGLTAVLSVVYLAVLLSYDAGLALIGLLLVLGYIAAVVVARVLQMSAIREAAQLDGEIASLTYETLDGIGKLRAAAAEDRALARWLDVYRRERSAGVRAGRVGVNFGAFADAYQTITLMLLFAGAGALAAMEAPAGVFIGFLAAFGSFQEAIVGLSQALLEIYSAQPLVERARPILEAETEIDPGRGDPGRLQGEIEGSGLVFAYGEGLAPVLNGLDFHVLPGQHMAIVGGSGSGKSTLLRLLLGFEAPQRGAVLYDGQDLARLDLTRVRSQIGVVLQASQLFAGSILENIRGAGDASLEQCLEAADRAGLKRDLEYFAMGVHTPITEGASALSGGQRQRILIARALAATPSILFFDEATSALDNATQAVVSQTLDALEVTRVTIAHRLSTVRHADRICVLAEGRFVEEGTFDDLMARNGAFAELARRQLTEE